MIIFFIYSYIIYAYLFQIHKKQGKLYSMRLSYLCQFDRKDFFKQKNGFVTLFKEFSLFLFGFSYQIVMFNKYFVSFFVKSTTNKNKNVFGWKKWGFAVLSWSCLWFGKEISILNCQSLSFFLHALSSKIIFNASKESVTFTTTKNAKNEGRE